DFYRIVSRILINWSRKDKIIFENDYSTPLQIKNHKFYDKTLNFLKASGLKHLKLYELDSILETLFLLDPKKYETLDKDTSIFINEVNKVFGLDLSNNLQTVMRISNTLRVGKLKCEYDFYENKEVYGLNDSQKDHFKKISKIVNNQFHNFYFEDILYLSTILKNHFSNSEITKNKYKRVVIIDDTFDNMYGSLLTEYLKNFSFIVVVKVIKTYEISSLLENVFEVDYIITIDDLNDFDLDIPLIKISREYFLDNTFEFSGLNSILK
ncbi:MAG: hypothetical protein ACRCZO_14735, partial [Cetobacterium sp.]